MQEPNVEFGAPPEILLVEDDDLDIELFYAKLRKAELENTVMVATNGLQALEILAGQRGLEPSLSCILLVDINMPKLDGLELLSRIRRDPKWRHAIVYMLTTSNHQPDVVNASRLGIAGYLLKDNLDLALRGEISTLRTHLQAGTAAA